jgi:hypothetical protein
MSRGGNDSKIKGKAKSCSSRVGFQFPVVDFVGICGKVNYAEKELERVLLYI